MTAGLRRLRASAGVGAGEGADEAESIVGSAVSPGWGKARMRETAGPAAAVAAQNAPMPARSAMNDTPTFALADRRRRALP